jgi:TonB family protein
MSSSASVHPNQLFSRSEVASPHYRGNLRRSLHSSYSEYERLIMKNRTAVSLFVLVLVLMFAPSHTAAQESPEGSRKIVTKVIPQYPNIARTMRLQGVVRVDVLVAPDGKVEYVEVKGGHPVLADAAQNALRQWKWAPAPHETHDSVELRFNP